MGPLCIANLAGSLFTGRMVNTELTHSGRYPDDFLKCIFVNENVSIAIKISMMFVAMGPINNIFQKRFR